MKTKKVALKYYSHLKDVYEICFQSKNFLFRIHELKWNKLLYFFGLLLCYILALNFVALHTNRFELKIQQRRK